MSSTFLTAEWRKLIMAQYAIDPALLQPHLPAGLELDLYGPGRQCFVSLVGFLFTRVRLKGIAIPFHTSFAEINLRFYVVRHMPDGTQRRGVVFLSEIVPRAAITLVARALYGEAYRTAPTRTLWRTPNPSSPETELDIAYRWRLPGARCRSWQYVSVQASPTPQPLAPDSLEAFITEHYWGYTARTGLLPRRGTTGEYAVEHPQWQCYPVRSAQVAADFGALYGRAFAPLTGREPDHVLLAEGSAIAIRAGSHFTPER